MAEATQQKTILIVEDDPFIAMDLEDAFETSGYKVVGLCANVREGLDVLNKLEPTVATLDYNLGSETSIPLARELQDRKIPYLFISAQMNRAIFGHDLEKRPIIAKPFVPHQLVTIVEAMI